ncbi:MAG: hypothetical protein ACR2RB_11675 [Gammaproteobacteria bacterium]
MRISQSVALGLTVVTLILADTDDVSARHERGDRSPPSRASTLERAVKFIGGVEALSQLESFSIDARGKRWVLDEGENPGEGASNPGTFKLNLHYDVSGDRLRLNYPSINAFGVERQVDEIVTADLGYTDGQDGNFVPAARSAMLSDRVASIRKHQRLMNPHLILRDLVNERISAREVKSRWRRRSSVRILEVEDEVSPLRVYVSSKSGRILRITTMESDPLRRDVPLDFWYLGWHTSGKSLKFPKIVAVVYDRNLVQLELRKRVRINDDLDANMFDIPDDVTPVFDADLAARGALNHQHLQSFAALGFPRDGRQPHVVGNELSTGVYHLVGGSHHSLAVEQHDNVVVVEMPLEEFRAQAILDWVDDNIGKPVTHAVQSHHHADHSAGIRTFYAAGAEIVAHERAIDFYEDIFEAPSELAPDALSLDPTGGALRSVPADGFTQIDDDRTPVSIYTFDDHAQDMVIVEAGGVVFVVDSYSPNPAATALSPGGLALHQRILDLGLDVQSIAGGHGGVISFRLFSELAQSSGN